MAAYQHTEDEDDDDNPGFDNPGTGNITSLGNGAWLVANRVTIASDGGVGYGDNIALIIGGKDATMGDPTTILTFGQSTGSGTPGLFIRNTDVGAPWPGWGASYSGLQGLYVLDYADEAVFVPSIRANDISNEGTIENEGLIEIGD